MTASTETAQRPTLPAGVEIVAGEVRPATTSLDLVLEDPYRGTVLAAAAASDAGAVEEALAAADAAHRRGAWAGLGHDERAGVLEQVADALESELPRIAALEAFATGVPIRQAGVVGIIVPGAFRLAAQMLRAGVLREEHRDDASGRTVEVLRLPLGPAVCLVPWNAPAPMAAHKVASALAAGCPTLLKPSERAPYGTTVLATTVARVLADASVDPGVFQLVQGGAQVGAALVGDPRVRAVSFTGGKVAGAAVAAATTPRLASLQLELGGNNPLVVMPDADPEDAAHAAVDLLTTLNGQWCRALGRLVVPAALHDEVVERAVARLAGMRAGDPLAEDTDLGPLVHSGHRELLHETLTGLQERGATVHASTPVPSVGSFLAPSLLTGVDPADATEEIFGPVATVHAYRTEEEALALANGTPYGLEGYVVGTDTDRALDLARRVDAGEVKVNGSSIMSLHLMSPRPAWGMSGLGEEGTIETIRCFTGARVVGVEGSFALHGR